MNAPALFTRAYLYPVPQHLGFRLWYRTGAIWRFRPNGTGAMQDAASELRRTTLPRTRVNKPSAKARDPVGD